MISYTEGTAEDLARLGDLFQAEFDEVGECKHLLHLSINIPLYQGLINAGRGVIYLAKDGEEIVGYSSYTLSQHPKYMDSGLWAFGAGFFLKPEHRGARTAWRLVEFAEAGLRDRAVKFVLAGSRVNHDAAGRLYEAMGYSPHEVARLKALV